MSLIIHSKTHYNNDNPHKREIYESREEGETDLETERKT